MNALCSRPSLVGRGIVEKGHLVAVDLVGTAGSAARLVQIDALGIGRRQLLRGLAAFVNEDPCEVAPTGEDERAGGVLSRRLARFAGRHDLVDSASSFPDTD